MANRISSWSSAHSSCIFVDFGYCMDPLTCIADDFLLEISPRCSVINRDLPWKQSELHSFIFSSNSIEYFIANNLILQFTSRNIVTSLFSLATNDRHWPSTIAQRTHPMDLKYVCQQYFTCMCFLGFIRYNKTFIACGFRKYDNLFIHEYHIP
jgi:hypothetical protein